MPVQHITARPPRKRHTRAASHDDGSRSVAKVQSILRGMGWKGDLKTSGPLSPALTDGEFGPVTRRDWQQSANKRGLDPTFERLGPNTVRVSPATYAALSKLSGGVAGIYIPR
jgi:hypothetical protein